MKGIGALLVVGSAVWLGRALAKPLRRRVMLLEAWANCIGFLIPAIVWQQTPLPTALSDAARAYPILSKVLNSITQQLAERLIDVGTAFERALVEESALRPRDRQLLGDMAAKLGTSATSYQSDMLRTTEALVRQVAKEARGEDLKQARLVESLISLSGLALVILLL